MLIGGFQSESHARDVQRAEVNMSGEIDGELGATTKIKPTQQGDAKSHRSLGVYVQTGKHLLKKTVAFAPFDDQPDGLQFSFESKIEFASRILNKCIHAQSLDRKPGSARRTDQHRLLRFGR